MHQDHVGAHYSSYGRVMANKHEQPVYGCPNADGFLEVQIHGVALPVHELIAFSAQSTDYRTLKLQLQADPAVQHIGTEHVACSENVFVYIRQWGRLVHSSNCQHLGWRMLT